MIDFSILLYFIVITALPIAELRGGIPFALLSGLDPITAFFVAVIVNSLIFFPVFFGLRFFYEKIFSKWSFVQNLVERTQKNGKPYIEKYGLLGLAVFVAIPLPMTGAWTGSALAWLLGMEWKKSFLSIAAGVVVAGMIVTAISLGVLGGLKFLL